MPYRPKVKGKPCWWCPPILILDFLCQRESRKQPSTYMLYFTSFGCVAVLFFNEFFYEWFGCRFLFMLWSPLVSFLCLDNIYRYYRNRYIQKHNLPGPYGYGSIDNFPHYLREEET